MRGISRRQWAGLGGALLLAGAGARAESHLWTVPGTLGNTYGGLAWDAGSQEAPIVATTEGGTVVRINPFDGGHTVVAGRVSSTGQPDVLGQLVVEDGVIDFVNVSRRVVERIHPDGTTVVIAGDGSDHYPGDAADATTTGFTPIGIAIGPEGSRFLSTRNALAWQLPVSGQPFVRILAPTPGAGFSIRTLAGSHEAMIHDECMDALSTGLGTASPIARAPDGKVDLLGHVAVRELAAYTDGYGRARWQLTRIAGHGSNGDAPDAPDARDARIMPTGIAISAGGTRYVTERGRHQVRTLHPNPDGATYRSETLAGTGKPGIRRGHDGARARTAVIGSPSAIAAVPGGGALVATSRGLRFIGPDDASDDLLAAEVRRAEQAARAGQHEAVGRIVGWLENQMRPRPSGELELGTSREGGLFVGGRRVATACQEEIRTFLNTPVRAFRARLALEAIRQRLGAPEPDA